MEDGVTIVVGEQWAGRVTKWNGSTGAFLGVLATLDQPVSTAPCGVGLNTGIVALERDSSLAGQLGESPDSYASGRYFPDSCQEHTHPPPAVSFACCAVAVQASVLGDDISGYEGQTLRAFPGRGPAPIQFPTALALAPGLGLFVLQRGTGVLSLLSSITATATAMVDDSAWAGPGGPTYSPGSNVTFLASVVGPTDVVQYAWYEGDTLLSTVGPTLVYTVPPRDEGVVLYLTCIVREALGSAIAVASVQVGPVAPAPSPAAPIASVPPQGQTSGGLSPPAAAGVTVACIMASVACIVGTVACRRRRRGRVQTNKDGRSAMGSRDGTTILSLDDTVSRSPAHNLQPSRRSPSPSASSPMSWGGRSLLVPGT